MSTVHHKAYQERALALRNVDTQASPQKTNSGNAPLALTAPIKEENMVLAITENGKGNQDQMNTRGYNELMDEYSLH